MKSFCKCEKRGFVIFVNNLEPTANPFGKAVNSYKCPLKIK
jgi:hypothetical protein